MMWEACAAKIEAMGGEVRLGARVTGLEWNEGPGLWTVTYVDGDGASHAVNGFSGRLVGALEGAGPGDLPVAEEPAGGAGPELPRFPDGGF